MLIPPMVGREDYLSKLREYTEEAVSGRGVLVLASGEAGIGKTRLIEEFGKEIIGQGFRVLIGRCIPGNPIPFLPFHEALGKHPDLKSGKKGIGLVGFLGVGKRDAQLADNETILFETCNLLKKISDIKPTVLIIEDLHWADSTSIQMLHFLARNSMGLRVLMIGTYRPEEIGSTSTGEPHPLQEDIRIMRREGICREITLAPLNPKEIGMTIDGMLGMPADGSITQKIASESEGNPLFVVEILRYLNDSDSLTLRDGIWMLASGRELEIPPTVKEVMLRRIERLSEDERRIVEYASVVGTYFDKSTVSELLNLDELETLELLNRLEKSHQMVAPSDDDFRFNHELLRRVIYDQISTPRRKELHKVIGNILERRLPDDSVLGELSFHFYNSNITDKCLKYSLMAGEGCLKRMAMIEAVHYFKRALEMASAVPSKRGERLRALEGAGDAYIELYNLEISINFYDTCLSESEDQKSRARILRKLANCWVTLGISKENCSKAKGLLAEAERCSDIETVERAEINNLKAILAIYEGRFEEADRLSSEAEKLLEEANASSKLAIQYTIHALGYLSQGLVDNASSMLEKAKIINNANPSISADLQIAFISGYKHFCVGDYEEGLACLERASEMAKKIGNYGNLFMIYRSIALIFDSKGDFNGLLDESFKTLELSEKMEYEYERIVASALIIHALIRSGKQDEIENDYLETIRSTKTDDWNPYTFGKGLIEIVKGELHAENGDWSRSNKMFECGIELMSKANMGLLNEAIARSWYAEHLSKQGSKARAIEQYLKAGRLYKKLGNSRQEKWIEEKIASLNEVSTNSFLR